MFISPHLFAPVEEAHEPNHSLSAAAAAWAKHKGMAQGNFPGTLGKRKRAQDDRQKPQDAPFTTSPPQEKANLPPANTNFSVQKHAATDMQSPPYYPTDHITFKAKHEPDLAVAPDGPPPEKCRRKTLSPKLHRFAHTYSRPHQDALHPDTTLKHSPKLVVSASTLKSCHICHTRPRQKADLDSYIDCRRCGERTCFICIRMCEAQACGKRKICSSCCVERGAEGDVWCIDCLGENLEEDCDMDG
ncbi:hypothetical protein K402DRAFT_451912 [Aulographum hederae CBS 113979]|uniref:Uncharacterized protein n=1 Tax=Aulographum hederae CBS 113979 TaxID=1176131 RepID=A0A6G1H9J3_9PEZI|nr:hypothetical protein K402DRAFT_451912 [Aulographum hederae CBS 113979]